MGRVNTKSRKVKRRRSLRKTNSEYLARIEQLRLQLNNPLRDEHAAARHQAAIDEWNVWRQQVVNDFLFAARLTMEMDSLALSNILDGKYPTAQERELIVEIAAVSRAVVALEGRLQR